MLTDYIIMPGDHYQAACDKIRERTGKTDMIRSGDMATEIDNIPRGVELPSIADDVLGTAYDLAENKQLIDADGNIVTGTLIEVPPGSYLFGMYDHEVNGTKGDTTFKVAATWNVDALNGVIVRNGAHPAVRNVPTALLGDAECSDVAKGKTFTSAAGYLAVGTREESSGGVELPTIAEDVLGTASDLAEGKQLIDADGNIVTGEVKTYSTYGNPCTPEEVAGLVSFNRQEDGPILIRDGYIDLQASLSKFGDATADDVVKGKTFTSSAGLKTEGKINLSLLYEGEHEFKDGKIHTYFKPIGDCVVRSGTQYAGDIINGDELGDATAADVAAGKTFTSTEGLKVTGTMEVSGGGLTVKSGTTTSGTINTGLSEIEEFFIYKESQRETGLIHLHYSKEGGTSYLYASAWSTMMYGSKTIANGTTVATVSGGSITLPSSTATSGGLSSGVTYKWIAVGTE